MGSFVGDLMVGPSLLASEESVPATTVVAEAPRLLVLTGYAVLATIVFGILCYYAQGGRGQFLERFLGFLDLADTPRGPLLREG